MTSIPRSMINTITDFYAEQAGIPALRKSIRDTPEIPPEVMRTLEQIAATYDEGMRILDRAGS